MTSETIPPNWFGQRGFDVRLEWGADGARRAGMLGDVVAIVDVLSFGTAVAATVSVGAAIFPCRTGQDAETLAATLPDAALAVKRQDVPERERYSLSPARLLQAEVGAQIVLESPNGATCTLFAKRAWAIFVGALVNARATARAIAQAAGRDGVLRPITAVACGERWHEAGKDGALRFAIEDYIGAGAILSCLPDRLRRSPEAELCQAAFVGVRDDLPRLLRTCVITCRDCEKRPFQPSSRATRKWLASEGHPAERHIDVNFNPRQAEERVITQVLRTCGSGIELTERGFAEDVEFAARLDVFERAAVLRDNRLEAR